MAVAQIDLQRAGFNAVTQNRHAPGFGYLYGEKSGPGFRWLRSREARLLLWKATGDRTHLDEAKRLLGEHLAMNPPEDRESMCENLRVNREILAA